jgi:hypothetical protein
MTAQPRRQPHGRTVRCPGGYRAYLPNPLPPRLAWSDGLAAALSRADLAVDRLQAADVVTLASEAKRSLF